MSQQPAVPRFLERLRFRAKTKAPSSEAPDPEAIENKAADDLATTEKLLGAANEASGSARNLYLTLLGFCIFVLLVTGGLTDEKLLLDSIVALPLVEKVDLPLSVFFAVAPWLLVFIHGDLLLNFSLLAEKLHLFRELTVMLEASEPATVKQLRRRLSNFPFSQWVAGEGDYRLVAGIIVWSTVVVLPPVVLLATQIGFLPYHGVGVIWGQRIALLVDLSLIVAFWPSFRCNLHNRGWWSWWPRAVLNYKRDAGARGAWRLLGLIGVTLALSLFVATIPGEAWEEKVVAHLFGDPLDPKAKAPFKSAEDEKESYGNHCPPVVRCSFGLASWSVGVLNDYRREEKGSLGRCDIKHLRVLPERFVHLPGNLRANCTAALLFHTAGWPNWHRNLELDEKALDARGHLKPETLAELRSNDKKIRRKALDVVEPLDLRKRDLRFARLDKTVFPKADIRGAEMSDASLSDAMWDHLLGDAETVLRGARLDGAQLLEGRLSEVQLQGASLERASLEGILLTRAQLQGANLEGGQLQGAYLSWANLQGVNLSLAHLQGTRMQGARLQGANLTKAHLQVADLSWAGLQGSSLHKAELQGARLYFANLQGSDLRGAQLQGAHLDSAEMQGALLNEAQLQGATFQSAQLQGASLYKAELQGANLIGTAFELNGVARAKFGKLDIAWVADWVSRQAKGNTNALWANEVRKHLETASRRNIIGPALRRCWGNTNLRCAKMPSREDAVALAKLHGELACSEDVMPNAGSAIARQWAAIVLQLDETEDLVHAYTHRLASALLDPKCTGRPGLSLEQLTLLIKQADRPVPPVPAAPRKRKR